ncbi:MAG: hypothetical protein FJ106_09295 [Deltaproteobacteria bacterium]|nr:hypothetical protein [Deltaproteobacteria bacterium]
MGEDRVRRFVESLERTIQNNYHYLKETTEDFQKLCRLITLEKKVPRDIIIDIHKINKEIQDRLAEIKTIQQILQGKYRQYYRRSLLRDKEIMEFGSIAKYCYSKFEYTLTQIEAVKKSRERETLPKVDHQRKSFQWFSSKENQVSFIKNLRILMELDYEPTPEVIGEERREMTGERTLSLFLFNGDSHSLDKFQTQIRLREHDVIERSDSNELRGVMTHLRKADSSAVEKIFQHFMENKEFTRLKCLLLPIYSQKDLEVDISYLVKTTLQETKEGEVKTISV